MDISLLLLFLLGTIIGCLYLRGCCAMAGAIYLFYKLGILDALSASDKNNPINLVLFIVVGAILGFLMYLMLCSDIKNFRLNPFKK